MNENNENQQVTGLEIGTAISAAKNGSRIARKGWNGKGLFVFMQVPAEISMEVVPKMQSLPKNVKNVFLKRFHNPDSEETNSEFDHISYFNQMAIVNSSNEVNGWAPSVSDALANDWEVLD